MTRKDARTLAEMAARDGGFTVDVHTFRRPDSGFAFSARPDCERRLARLTPRAIRAYARDYARDLLPNGAHLGAWRDGGTWYLDVSTVTEDETLARVLAFAASQLAIFNLSTGQSVSLGV